MRHRKKSVKEFVTGAQKRGIVVRNLMTSLIKHGEVKTTSKRAKVLKSNADKLFGRLLRINSSFELKSEKLQKEYEQNINEKIKNGDVVLVVDFTKPKKLKKSTKKNTTKEEIVESTNKKIMTRDAAIAEAKKGGLDLLQVGIDDKDLPRCKMISFQQYLNLQKRREFAKVIQAKIFTKQDGKKIVEELLPKYIKGERKSGFVADYKLGVRPGDGAEKILVRLV